jgi:uncharacterized surface protein with fasciclin (FAS1) repeats
MKQSSQNIQPVGHSFWPVLQPLLWTSCVDNDPILDNYYTFTGEMVSNFLTNRSEYSSFVEILERAHLIDELATYGEYTCLAPTNQAISEYLAEKGRSAIAELTDAECDTIARTHLLKGAFYTTDLEDGALPTTTIWTAT